MRKLNDWRLEKYNATDTTLFAPKKFPQTKK